MRQYLEQYGIKTDILNTENTFNQLTNKFIQDNWGINAVIQKIEIQKNRILYDKLYSIFDYIVTSSDLTKERNYELAKIALRYLTDHKIDISAITTLGDLYTAFNQMSNDVPWDQTDTYLRYSILANLESTSLTRNPIGATWSIEKTGKKKKMYLYNTSQIDTALAQKNYQDSFSEFGTPIADAINMLVQLGYQYQSATGFTYNGTYTDASQYGGFYPTIQYLLNLTYDYDYMDPNADYGLGRDDRNLVLAALDTAYQNVINNYTQYRDAVTGYNNSVYAVDCLGDTGGPVIPSFITPESEWLRDRYINLYFIEAIEYSISTSYMPYTGIYKADQVPGDYWETHKNLAGLSGSFQVLAEAALQEGDYGSYDFYIEKLNQYSAQLFQLENNAFKNYDFEAYLDDPFIMAIFENMPGWESWRYNPYGDRLAEDAAESLLETTSRLDAMEREAAERNLAAWDAFFQFATRYNSGIQDYMNIQGITSLKFDSLRDLYGFNVGSGTLDNRNTFSVGSGGTTSLWRTAALSIAPDLSFKMPDWSKTIINEQLAQTFLTIGVPLFNVYSGVEDYKDGGYAQQQFLGYSIFSPDYFEGTPLAEVTIGTKGKPFITNATSSVAIWLKSFNYLRAPLGYAHEGGSYGYRSISPVSGNFGDYWRYEIVDASGTHYSIQRDRDYNYYYLHNNNWIPYEEEGRRAARQMGQLADATGTAVFNMALTGPTFFVGGGAGAIGFNTLKGAGWRMLINGVGQTVANDGNIRQTDVIDVLSGGFLLPGAERIVSSSFDYVPLSSDIIRFRVIGYNKDIRSAYMDQAFSYGGYKLQSFAEKWVLKNSGKYPYNNQQENLIRKWLDININIPTSTLRNQYYIIYGY
ncbi:hypothetical protein [Niabella aurantiaca]|uniref:hypothetical protein n=1 Tax=Niabella aurantiaca TaxID=379900 RepID=UPI000380C5BF|nr:hypothetical protein [Niabella aurantiaca]